MKRSTKKEQPSAAGTTKDCTVMNRRCQKYCKHSFDNNIVSQKVNKYNNKMVFLKVCRL